MEPATKEENIKENPEVVISNKKPPVIIVYCPKCGLPPEYCEFDDKCKAPASTATNEDKNLKPIIKEKEENKSEKVEGEQPKEEQKPKKKVAVKEENKIVISKQTRSKKKFITSVTGLDKFNVVIKDFAKKMGKKFACGASAISDDTIEIQGDIMEELMEFILKEFPHLNEKQIVIKEKR